RPPWNVGDEETPLGGNPIARLLSPYYLDLLVLLRNPKKDASFLAEMAVFLRSAPAAALQPSFDYTLFPFLLLLDAAVQCREEK
ncbi:unnamed protein product, partial [Musa acuminata var. zebrina]